MTPPRRSERTGRSEHQTERENIKLICRQALAESLPPCIPYIGLILQDLTFVQIGNQDFLDEKINFAKRWQQFNILVLGGLTFKEREINVLLQDNLQRFKKEQYNITRNEDLILFFGDFEEYLTEDEMWNLSETIKPRGAGSKSNKWRRYRVRILSVKKKSWIKLAVSGLECLRLQDLTWTFILPKNYCKM